jgi:hypothetical protein
LALNFHSNDNRGSFAPSTGASAAPLPSATA